MADKIKKVWAVSKWMKHYELQAFLQGMEDSGQTVELIIPRGEDVAVVHWGP